MNCPPRSSQTCTGEPRARIKNAVPSKEQKSSCGEDTRSARARWVQFCLLGRPQLTVKPARSFGLQRVHVDLNLVNVTAFGASQRPVLEAVACLRRSRQGVRSVLYDQTCRQGHWSWPLTSLWVHQTIGRPHQYLFRARSRNDDQALSSAVLWCCRFSRQAHLVRYIDDFVICFQYRSDALRVQDALRLRLGKFGLTLEPTKTKLVEFGRFAQKHAGKRGRNRPGNNLLSGPDALLHAEPKR